MTEWEELKAWLTPNVIGWWIWIFLFIVCVYNAYSLNATFLDSRLMCDSDPEGYYQYLPTLVNDVSFLKMRYAIILENDKNLNLFTIGVAILQLPFFLLTVGYTDLMGISTNYYDTPFFIGMAIGTAVYTATAFRMLFLVLVTCTSRLSALIGLGMLFVGTNVFYYAAREPISSHMYSFFLVSGLIYLSHTIKHHGFTNMRAFWIVVCAALAALIRQPNVIFAAIPFVLFVDSKQEIQHRMKNFLGQRKGIVGGILIALVIWGIQGTYWYAITGSFHINPYSYKDEGFSWLRPELWNVLFSHQNGLFIYAPILMFAVGWSIYRALNKDWTHMYITGVFLFVWYLYSAWWCWWLGGAFGHRGFVDMLPLLAIPGVLFIQYLRGKGRILSWALFVVCTLLAGVTYELSIMYWWPWEGDEWTWETLRYKWGRAFVRVFK